MRPIAPSVDGTLWINSDPIGPDVWRARTSVIVFWSVGCEASWSLLHRLDRLKSKRGGELCVVAVHSPRFVDEQDPERLRTALARSPLSLPVLHDPKLTTWGRFDPPGWPSVVLIDHRGRVIASGAGIGPAVLSEAIDQQCRLAAAYRVGKPKLPRPVAAPVAQEHADLHHQLRWPSGVDQLPDGRVALVDSGNRRLLILEVDDDAVATVSTEIRGLEHATRVCALNDNTVAISQPALGRVIGIDLTTRRHWLIAEHLSRPTGMTLDNDDSLVIADSGADKLVRVVDPLSEVSEPERGHDATDLGTIAGSGVTGVDDGPAGRASLAQPVAAVRSGDGLAFLDLASSSLRVLTDKGRVLTSSKASMHEAGLVDGPLHRALFDRPVAITARPDGSLLIAESGSSRIRKVDNRRVSTLGVAGLNAPEALVSLQSGAVLVADTGNDRLVLLDEASTSVREVEVHGLLPPVDTTLTGPDHIPSKDQEPRETASPSSQNRTVVDWPATGRGPWTITVQASPTHLTDGRLRFKRISADEPLVVPLAEAGSGTILITATGTDPVHAASTRVELVVSGTSPASESVIEPNSPTCGGIGL